MGIEALMFQRLAPQQVRHSDGYIVQVADRHHVEYLDGVDHWLIEVEFAPVTGIFRSSLHGQQPSVLDPNEVLNRIAAGLEAMGCEVEVC